MLKNKITKSLALVLVFMLMTSLTVFADVSGEGKDNLSEISTENIMKHLNVLSPGDNARIAGSDGERAAGDYIEKLFKDEYKLDKVERPSFDTILFHDNGATLIRVPSVNIAANSSPSAGWISIAGISDSDPNVPLINPSSIILLKRITPPGLFLLPKKLGASL